MYLKEAVEKLSDMNHPDGDCPLCLFPLVTEEHQSETLPFMKLMSCFHCFHSECIIRWWNWLESSKQTGSSKSDNATARRNRAAIQCLKRKRLYEQQIEQLGNFQLRIHDQMIMLEGAKATTETVDALRTGAAAMKAMQKATNIDDVDKTMDEINEQTENMKQIQEALSTPIGAAADFDEDELEAELEELESAELEEQLLQPATTAPAATSYVPAGRQPTRPVPAKPTPEEDELAALQAEMAQYNILF
ncbi:hypothetical protein KIW84_023379 [Lathyrus oleraceus]|uniref:RING-type domain-containing protein n=2 Tax=Pisum sativum TaxID=3888 RepID=A0A9D4YCT8_PEA|nr:hypothetical protein KIW84_023379 [Pisum sativum]